MADVRKTTRLERWKQKERAAVRQHLIIRGEKEQSTEWKETMQRTEDWLAQQKKPPYYFR